jgi:hypothetical protein
MGPLVEIKEKDMKHAIGDLVKIVEDPASFVVGEALLMKLESSLVTMPLQRDIHNFSFKIKRKIQGARLYHESREKIRPCAVSYI